MITTSTTMRLIGSAALALVVAVTQPCWSASAQPPGFPDLNNFSPVAPDNFFMTDFRGGPGARSLTFHTPYSLNCAMDASDPKALGTTAITCTGALPDTADGDCVLATIGGGGQSGSYQMDRSPARCAPFLSDNKELEVGQKVTYRNITCVVGADQLTACLDTQSGSHGFLLKPSGSVSF